MIRPKRTCAAAVLAALVLSAFSGCRPPAPRLRPPAVISGLEGYASLRLSAELGGVKSRFSFRVAVPGRGRVEVFDVLGRVLFYFVLDGGQAQFVLPGRRAYCLVPSDEVMARFLGFALDLGEWTALLSGVWPQEAAAGKGDEPPLWTISRDGRGRVVSGRRGEAFFFEVEQFFEGGPSPRRLSFGAQAGGGRLTVLELRFHSVATGPDMALAPPPGFRPTTWEDMERMLRRED